MCVIIIDLLLEGIAEEAPLEEGFKQGDLDLNVAILLAIIIVQLHFSFSVLLCIFL